MLAVVPSFRLHVITSRLMMALGTSIAKPVFHPGSVGLTASFPRDEPHQLGSIR